MAEIDVDIIRKNTYIEVLHNLKYTIQKTILNLMTGAEVATGLYANDGTHKTLIFLGALATASIGSKITSNKVYNEFKNVFDNKIKQTEEYQTCIKEYKEFVKNLASLIKYLKIENPKEIIVFYEILLNSGLLSKKSEETGKFHHEYRLYKHEINPMEELSGARIASGKTVCRHQSAMLIDLLNELGIKACNISCKHVGLKEAKKLIKRKSKDYNHSIVGIIENDNKYLFDCTIDTFAEVSQEKKHKNSLANNIEVDDNYYYLSKKCININENLKEIRKQFDTIKNSQIDKNELATIRKKIEELFEEQMKIIIYFYIKEQERINKIAILEALLCPTEDEPQSISLKL